jgi:hypothetical protein
MTSIKLSKTCVLDLVLFVCLVALGFDIRASHLLGRRPTTLQPLRQPFFVLDGFEIGSWNYLPRVGVKQWSSWLLPPEYLGLQAWATAPIYFCLWDRVLPCRSSSCLILLTVVLQWCNTMLIQDAVNGEFWVTMSDCEKLIVYWLWFSFSVLNMFHPLWEI